MAEHAFRNLRKSSSSIRLVSLSYKNRHQWQLHQWSTNLPSWGETHVPRTEEPEQGVIDFMSQVNRHAQNRRFSSSSCTGACSTCLRTESHGLQLAFLTFFSFFFPLFINPVRWSSPYLGKATCTANSSRKSSDTKFSTACGGVLRCLLIKMWSALANNVPKQSGHFHNCSSISNC